MDKLKIKEQVESIRQAFSYINRFKGETFVIKIDSSLIGNDLFPILIKDLTLLHSMGIKIVLVPGARTRINEVLSTFRKSCDTVDGIRISSPDSIPFIKMAAFDVSNKVMTMLAENGTNAIIGNWVKARAIGIRNGTDYQSSGIVEKVQTDIIKRVLADDMIPIFPNIGWNSKGKPYNLSSNELAFTLSIALNAAKLFFINELGGVQVNDFKIPENVFVSDDNLISQLTVTQAGDFLTLNASSSYKEQIELITLAHEACKKGVKRVHIIDGQVEGMILQEIFSNRGQGTMVYANQHENIRKMSIADIPEVLTIMQPQINEFVLVPRSAADLEEKLDDFVVYEVDGTVHACGALHIYPGQQGEIAAIAVDELYSNAGIGGKIISYFLEQATNSNLKSVFVLTTQTSDWFAQFGFKKADISCLPPEKARVYDKTRNSMILNYKISKQHTKVGYNVD